MIRFKGQTTVRRSKLMSKIHSTGGKDEVLLRKKLWHLGLRYQINVKTMPGKPDIVFSKYKIAIFIDGEFWHGYNWKEKRLRIKRNRDYWIRKISHNINHDSQINQELHNQGWTVLRFWASKVLKNPDYYVNLVLYYINARQEDPNYAYFFQG